MTTTHRPAATLTDQEILAALQAIPAGKADVINNRAVLSERGGFVLEGFGNRVMAWNRAVEKLRRPMRSRAT